MDVVLEVFDTYLFDRVYATLLPISQSITFDPVSTLAASLKTFANHNATFAQHQQQQQQEYLLTRSSWQYTPTTDSFSLEPSEYAYLSRWDRDNLFRQFVSFFIISSVFANVLYFTFATLSYIFIFDKTTVNHPKYLKNQMKLEIQQAIAAIPTIAIFTAPWFVAEVRGYSFIYDNLSEVNHPIVTHIFGSWYTYLQFPIFLMFTDFCIYWIHRALHHPILYRRLHKPHHKWIMPTPYASLAFHPLDGYAQSVPYHLFPFLFPLHKFAYIALFTFIQIWTVMIHDGEYVANSPIINGAACHTMHHLYFNYNYGQFTTLWDRLGGSYRKPNEELFKRETKTSDAEWKRQAKEMEKMVVEVEGKDDRSYEPDVVVKKVQ
ncbi:unnamed protein product [Zymoseptoria tritici ST99CH_3D1]|nr:unnamed protein product [Zymoseptoria tritici ST99CH_3D1]